MNQDSHVNSLQREADQLLERAMAQPGVAELMQLYQSQKTIIDEHLEAQRASAPRWVVGSSASSSR